MYKRQAQAFFKLDMEVDSALLERFVCKLAKVEKISLTNSKPQGCIGDVGEYVQSFVKLEGIDLSAIITRLQAQDSKLQKEITKLSAQLENPNFVKNAPAQVLEQTKAGLKNAQELQQKVQNELKALQV